MEDRNSRTSITRDVSHFLRNPHTVWILLGRRHELDGLMPRKEKSPPLPMMSFSRRLG